jgi:hypothetical protein
MRLPMGERPVQGNNTSIHNIQTSLICSPEGRRGIPRRLIPHWKEVARGVVAVFFIHLDYTPQGLAGIYRDA